MFNKILLLLSLFIFSINTFAAGNPHVRIVTNKGNIEVELYPKAAPESVKNFLQYVTTDYYNGTVFHRVIKNFMIQGGGFTTDLQKKQTQAPIINEASNMIRNDRGTIAMARTNAPHSATSQFFINTKDNNFLNHTSKSSRGWGYTVFGKVTKGLDVMVKIENTRTGAKGMFPSDVPLENIVIEKIEVISE